MHQLYEKVWNMWSVCGALKTRPSTAKNYVRQQFAPYCGGCGGLTRARMQIVLFFNATKSHAHIWDLPSTPSTPSTLILKVLLYIVFSCGGLKNNPPHILHS